MLTELTRHLHEGGGLPDGYLECMHAMVTYRGTLRDLLAAQQHVYVADLNYDALGRHLTELIAQPATFTNGRDARPRERGGGPA